jgi:uncharacterized membrane protein YfcA
MSYSTYRPYHHHAVAPRPGAVLLWTIVIGVIIGAAFR